MKNTENNEINEILNDIQHLKKIWGKTIEENLKNNLEEVNSDNEYLDRLYPST